MDTDEKLGQQSMSDALSRLQRTRAADGPPPSPRWAALAQALSPGRAGTGGQVSRFALVGTTCALVQLGLLQILVQGGVQENLANLIAFGVSIQVNFVASQFYTWRDRWTPALGPSPLVRRLFLFNGSAATTGVVNQGVFGLANLLIWYLPAAALGIAVAAVTNFLLNDRLVFRRSSSRHLPTVKDTKRPENARRSRPAPPA